MSGGFVSAATEFEGVCFKLALQRDPGQRIARRIARKVFRRNVDDDSGIGVALGARILAHPVGDHAVGFRGGSDDLSARAHAEAIHGPAVAGVIDQFVVCRADQRIAGVGAESCLVDQGLRVFDAKADGKRLGFHEYAGLVQHFEGVAGAVPERQDDLVGGDFLAIGQGDAAHVAGFDVQASDPALKADFAAERLDFTAHVFNHADQAESADVRPGDVENLGRCAGFYEFLKHLASEMARVFDLTVEFAVGEGTGAAFAELHIGFGVEHFFAP